MEREEGEGRRERGGGEEGEGRGSAEPKAGPPAWEGGFNAFGDVTSSWYTGL